MIQGDGIPFLKNFTGIASAKGQWLPFQRDASAGAGWAGEQVEGSVLGPPDAGHLGGCRLALPCLWGQLPWGHPLVSLQEPSSSLNPSYPQAQSCVMQMHTCVPAP